MEKHCPEYWNTNNGSGHDRQLSQGYTNYQDCSPVDRSYGQGLYDYQSHHQSRHPWDHTYHHEHTNYPDHGNNGYQFYQGNEFHMQHPTMYSMMHGGSTQFEPRQQNQSTAPPKKPESKQKKQKKRLSGGSQTYSRRGPTPEQREQQRQAQLIKNKAKTAKSVLNTKLTIGDFVKDKPQKSKKCEKIRADCCVNKAQEEDKGKIEVNTPEQIEVRNIQCDLIQVGNVVVSIVNLEKVKAVEVNDLEVIDIVVKDDEDDIEEDTIHYGITMCCFD